MKPKGTGCSRNYLHLPLAVLSLLLFLQTSGLHAVLWTQPTGPDDGWKESSWFGGFYSQSREIGWVWTPEHDWMYAVGDDESAMWLYDLKLGWMWTGEPIYPFFFQARNERWLWYWKGSTKPRWFADMDTSLFFGDDSIPAAGETTPEYTSGSSSTTLTTVLQLSDGTSVELPPTPDAPVVVLRRESNSLNIKDTGLMASGSVRVLELPEVTDTLFAPVLQIPTSEIGSLPRETMNVMRIGPGYRDGVYVPDAVVYLPVFWDDAGNMRVRDAFLSVSSQAHATNLQQQRSSSKLTNLKSPQEAPVNLTFKYLPVSINESLNYKRAPELIRMIPSETADAKRVLLRDLPPEQQKEENLHVVQNVIVFVHGHNEEEKGGIYTKSAERPWYFAYKRDVWTLFYDYMIKENKEAMEYNVDYFGCTRFYEFVYPTYRSIFNDLDDSLITQLYDELGPQLKNGQSFNLVFIAHSMGGLVARAAVNKLPIDLEPNFQKLITWGTPHLGSPLVTLRYAMGAELPYDFNSDKAPEILQGILNPYSPDDGWLKSWGKHKIASLLKQGIAYAFNKLQLDTPGSRDLRFVRQLQGDNAHRMALDTYLLMTKEQNDTTELFNQYNLNSGTWLYNENLRILNENDRFKNTYHYAFLYGLTSKSIAEVYFLSEFPYLEIAGSQIGAGSKLIRWLMRTPEAPYLGAMLADNDGAGPIFSMVGDGIATYSYNVGDIDHEEYYGAPNETGFTKSDLATITLDATFDALFTSEDEGPSMYGITYPPYMVNYFPDTGIKMKGDLYLEDMSYSRTLKSETTLYWPGDKDPIKRLKNSNAIEAWGRPFGGKASDWKLLTINKWDLKAGSIVETPTLVIETDIGEFFGTEMEYELRFNLRDGTQLKQHLPVYAVSSVVNGPWKLTVGFSVKTVPESGQYHALPGAIPVFSITLDASGKFSGSQQIVDNGQTYDYTFDGTFMDNTLNFSLHTDFTGSLVYHSEEWDEASKSYVPIVASYGTGASVDIRSVNGFRSLYWSGYIDENSVSGDYSANFSYERTRDGVVVETWNGNGSGPMNVSINLTPVQ